MVERALALVALLSLAACTSTADLRKAELSELAGWLPGAYEAKDASLAFVPIYAPFISDHVFVEEAALIEGGRRVVTQRVVAFDVLDKQIMQASYIFADPGRWRAGLQHPEIFKSLLEADLKLQSGCEMLWIKDKDDGKFVGTNDAKHCRGALARAEVSADGYARGVGEALERFRRQ